MKEPLFDLMTDSCCDLPYDYLRENDVQFVSMVINLDEKEYVDDLGKTFDSQWFINELKAGKMPSTSQINLGIYLAVFNKYVGSDRPLLYLCFSSALSGSYNNALAALAMLQEEHGPLPITVIDTKAASLGEGLLVYEATERRKQGASLAEVVTWVEAYAPKLHSWVTVNDLAHLQRGGRISKVAAAVGSLIKIKPMIVVDRDGRLINFGNVRSRHNALKKLVDKTAEGIVDSEQQTIFIAYAGDVAAAQEVEAGLEALLKVKAIKLLPMGPTIASHTGYGAIAVFSFGEERV